MRKLSGVAVPSCSCGSSHRGAMAVCHATVMAALAADAEALVMPSAGNCATMAAPPANISLLVNAIELSGLPLSAPMVTSLCDPVVRRGAIISGPAGMQARLCDEAHADRAAVLSSCSDSCRTSAQNSPASYPFLAGGHLAPRTRHSRKSENR